MVKAIVLFSGGLDSLLATKLILEQGVELEAVHFLNIFSSQKEDIYNLIDFYVKKLGIKFKVFEMDEEFFDILKKPKYGYGSQMNPCIDCRIFMLKKAGQYMKETGASFLITGEVLNERPMSQRKDILAIIDRESGLEGFVLRPLSAKLLGPTLPEKMGWVKRDKFLSIKGRSRKIQIKLAEQFGFQRYLWPSGGCLLTDPAFSHRLKDMLKYKPDFDFNDIELLKLGRHFRISKKTKLIVGRNQKENEEILKFILKDDLFFYPVDTKGPIAIGRGEFNKEIINICAGIVARYCDKETDNNSLRIACKKSASSEIQLLNVFSLSHSEIKRFQI